MRLIRVTTKDINRELIELERKYKAERIKLLKELDECLKQELYAEKGFKEGSVIRQIRSGREGQIASIECCPETYCPNEGTAKIKYMPKLNGFVDTDQIGEINNVNNWELVD